MGATMSSKSGSSPAMMRPTHLAHVPAAADSGNNTTGKFGSNLSSREEIATGFAHSMSPFGHKAAGPSASGATAGASIGAASGVPPSLLHDMVSSLSSATGFEGTAFEDAFGSILDGKKDENSHDTLSKTSTTSSHLSRTHESGGGGGGEGLTRDFLGLRPLSHSDILSMAGLGNCMNNSNEHQDQTPKHWQG